MGNPLDVEDLERTSDEDVYRKHAEELIRFATGLVGPNDAADVVSSAVVASLASKGWHSVRNRRSYLYRAVMNQAKKTHRDRQRRWTKELRAASTDQFHMSEYRPEVLAAVKRLSVRQRAVTVLCYWDGMTVPEVAEELGLSDGSVRRHLARARANLRGALHD